MEFVFEEALGAARDLASLLSMLASLAPVLGAVGGVYGMISHLWDYAIRIALLGVGALVAFGPARRASRTDPAPVLRQR